MSIIDLKHIDYNLIKQDLYNYIKSRDDYVQIEEALGTNMDMFLSVVAGYATYNAYKYKMWREETYIDTAKLDTSIFHLAKTFGFNIKRPFTPMIEIIYNEIPTIELMPGTILGSYDNLDIVYIGKPLIIEKGDKIPVYIGHFNTLDYIPVKAEEYIHLEPNLLSAIHNEIWYEFNGFDIITKSLEDYIIYKIPVDFSDTNYSTNIILYDKDNYFGNPDMMNQTVKIYYLETDGEMDSITLNNISLDSQYYPSQILTKGSRGHTVDEIKKLTPFYFQTLRRMVTIKDHKYILETIDFIKSVYVERDNGLPSIYKLSLKDTCLIDGVLPTDKTIELNIYNKYYTIDLTTGMTKQEIMETILNNIKRNRNINVELDSQYNLIIDTIDGRIIDDFYIKFVNCDFILEQLDEGKRPLCCTIKVYYIKTDTVDEPILLTDKELEIINEKTNEYKMVGTKLLYIPAQPVYKDLAIKIRLSDFKYFDQVKEEIYKITQSYELQLDKDFLYGEFLSRVANIEIYDENEQKLVSPVIYIEPNQEMFDINISGKYYIKFSNIDIQIG